MNEKDQFFCLIPGKNLRKRDFFFYLEKNLGFGQNFYFFSSSGPIIEDEKVVSFSFFCCKRTLSQKGGRKKEKTRKINLVQPPFAIVAVI